jgi:hypothetical protein
MSTLLTKRSLGDENEQTLEPSKRFRTFDSSLAEKILESYPETKPVRKNKKLQEIFFELKYGPFEPIGTIETLLKINNWKGFDQYCIENRGEENFWITLQNLFYWYYFCPEDQRIDFTPMQKALGIQQVQWQEDEANEYQNLLIELGGARPWNHLDDQQLEMLGKLIFKNERKYFQDNSSFLKHVDNLRKDMVIRTADVNPVFNYFHELNETMQNSVCTDVTKHMKSTYTMSGPLTCQENIKRLLHDSIWYTNNFLFKNVLGIPASYDLSSVSCLHQPILVFGSMKPKTMVNFIIETNKRPYAAFLPKSSVNLYDFGADIGNILYNWDHDFTHQDQSLRRNGACKLENTIDALKKCTNNDINEENINDFYKSEEFQNCLEDEYFAEKTLLDNGYIYKKYDQIEGGKRRKKRKTYRRRKTQKCKRRKTRRSI